MLNLCTIIMLIMMRWIMSTGILSTQWIMNMDMMVFMMITIHCIFMAIMAILITTMEDIMMTTMICIMGFILIPLVSFPNSDPDYRHFDYHNHYPEEIVHHGKNGDDGGDEGGDDEDEDDDEEKKGKSGNKKKSKKLMMKKVNSKSKSKEDKTEALKTNVELKQKLAETKSENAKAAEESRKNSTQLVQKNSKIFQTDVTPDKIIQSLDEKSVDDAMEDSMKIPEFESPEIPVKNKYNVPSDSDTLMKKKQSKSLMKSKKQSLIPPSEQAPSTKDEDMDFSPDLEATASSSQDTSNTEKLLGNAEEENSQENDPSAVSLSQIQDYEDNESAMAENNIDSAKIPADDDDFNSDSNSAEDDDRTVLKNTEELLNEDKELHSMANYQSSSDDDGDIDPSDSDKRKMRFFRRPNISIANIIKQLVNIVDDVPSKRPINNFSH